jgi:hypothetical protein
MAKGIFNTPNSVKALRRYWKNRAEFPDPQQLAEEIFSTSDRASVILSATLLDDALATRLAAIFGVRIDSAEFDHIFRFEGPLGSFASRIEISSLFRVLDDTTCRQLHVIREMRNACAHTKRPISFETPALLNVVKQLFYPRGFLKPRDDTKAEITKAFHFEVLALVNIIIHGHKGEKKLAFLEDYAKSFPDVFFPSPDR